jgi:hypothetical protein
MKLNYIKFWWCKVRLCEESLGRLRKAPASKDMVRYGKVWLGLVRYG